MKIALFIAAWSVVAAQTPDCAAVPGSTQKGALRNFDTETLYEYMNGNSEGYFLYGFVRMQGVTCEKGTTRFNLDVSTFKDPESAYGMFMSAMDARQPTEALGMSGQVLPRRLAFAKGSYYVEMSVEPEGDHLPTMKQAAAYLVKNTPGESTLPAPLTWLPADGVQSGTKVRLIPQSVLGLRMLSRGYVGQYDRGKAFLVTEASPEAAQALFAKLRERLGPGEPAQIGLEAFQGKDRYLGRLCIFRKGPHLAGWVNVPDSADPVQLANGLAAKLP